MTSIATGAPALRMGNPPTASTGGDVDLKTQWGTFYDNFTAASGVDGLMKLIAVIGFCVALGAIGKWVWDKRRGGGFGGGGGFPTMAVVVGAAMAAPTALIPVFFLLLDAVINGVINIVNGVTG